MYSSEQLKAEKKIRNKRNGRTRTIWGWVLLVVGVLNLIDAVQMFHASLTEGLQDCFLPVALTCVGAWLIWSTKKNVEKWNKYDVLINQNGNTPLDMIAEKMGLSIEQVRKDIQQMINEGFIRDENGNVGAYIHGEYDILVMMRNGQPKEPVEKTVKEQQAEAEAEAAAAAAEAAKKERRKDEYADAIGKAAAEVSDPDVADSLRSIESSVRKINRKIDRKPELKDSDSVRQLREIYLPKTMELVEKLTTQDAGPEAMLEIKGILNTCAVAYKGIVDKVYKREDEDTLIDIEVLKQTFEREGLLGSDFDVK